MIIRQLDAGVGSALHFIAAPGVVAGLGPWWLTGWRSADPPTPAQASGALLIVAGVLVLIDAFARFAVEGRGTPAPIAPTGRLVVRGFYGYVRNPMYLAVAAVIAGQALVLARPVLVAYTFAFLAVSVAFVRWYEEPSLRRRFGIGYTEYAAAVPAWFPRLRRVTGVREPGGAGRGRASRGSARPDETP